MIKLIEDYLDDNEEFWDYHTSEYKEGSKDIFDTTAQESTFGEQFLDDFSTDYLKNNKNLTSKIVMMSPKEYYEDCAKQFSIRGNKTVTSSSLKSQRAYDKDILEHLKDVLFKYHKKFPITYINYAEHGQEGLHRMYVAGELFGWNTKFPVLIIDYYDKEKQKKIDAQKLKNEVLSDFKSALYSISKYLSNDTDILSDFKNDFENELNRYRDDDKYDYEINHDNDNVYVISSDYPDDIHFELPIEDFIYYDYDKSEDITFNTFDEAENYINDRSNEELDLDFDSLSLMSDDELEKYL